MIGTLREYTPGGPATWASYVERLQYYFDANSIDSEDQKKAVFLTTVGDHVYTIARGLSKDQKTSNHTFKELVTLLTTHFEPTRNVIVERYEFYKCTQQPEETITEFIMRLKEMAAHCQFKELDNMLRDRLVCGAKSRDLKLLFFREPDLTFQTAEKLALASEAAIKNVEQVQDSANILKSMPLGTDTHKATVSGTLCRRCGNNHPPGTCWAAKVTCRFCKKLGHIEKICMAKKRSIKKSPVNHMGEGNPETTQFPEGIEDVEELEQYATYAVLDNNTDVSRGAPFLIDVLLDRKKVTMEVDSGATRTIISEETFSRLWQDEPALGQTNLILKTWGQQMVPVLGTRKVDVTFRDKQASLQLLVAKGKGPSLLGRNWFAPLGIKLEGLHYQDADGYLGEFAQIFQPFGTYSGPPISIEVDPSVAPIYRKSRSIPFAIREKVSEELDRQIKLGILVPVPHSSWATPIVPILKSDGSIRLCGDYKCTVNLAVRSDTYPLPTASESFASLAGGRFFTKLDLESAYTQIRVDDESSKILTWNTPKGLLAVKRLPFGIASAPGLFQRKMEALLAGLPGVAVLLDDILITGRNLEEHWERVREVLRRLDQAGLRLKRKKCFFAADSVVFLGYRVDANGIHPTEEKVRAVHEAAPPTDKRALQSFLGLLNFYERFLPQKATILEPLHRLLDDGKSWQWLPQHQAAFEQAKNLLKSDQVLVHHDVTRPLVMACDASPYGVGVVISHIMDDQSERPIAYGSRTLHPHERNYAQIDREALSIIFGLTKFRDYLYGRHFVIYTDHRPLLGLFHPTRQTPAVMSPRMLRWSIMLNAFSYELEYRPGKLHGNADGFSRLPRPNMPAAVVAPADIYLLDIPEQMEKPITAEEIAQATSRDPELSVVYRYVMQGWPEDTLPEELASYSARRSELTTHKGCLLWGNRVVIPSQFQPTVLELLHSSHQGIVQTKSIARSYFWWPKLDKAIEEEIKSCATCQACRNHPPKAPHHPWLETTNPWSRLHLDFAGPFKGKTYLIVVDAHSGWPEIVSTSSMTSKTVIQHLSVMFATHGLPDVLVSDNGTPFVSAEFQEFVTRHGIRHKTSAPYHPSTNGTAERMVQTLKQMLRKSSGGGSSTDLLRILFAIRTTPRATTGRSPAEMLMNRTPRSLWSRLHPHTSTRKAPVDPQGTRSFKEGDLVSARNYSGQGDKWLPGRIRRVLGPVLYEVTLQTGDHVRRHIDQLLGRGGRVDNKSQATANDQGGPSSTLPSTRADDDPDDPPERRQDGGDTEEIAIDGPAEEQPEDPREEPPEDASEGNRPKRACRRPTYLEDFD